MSARLIFGGQYVKCVSLEKATKFLSGKQLPFYRYGVELRIQIFGEDFNSIRAKGQERIELYETGGIIQFRTRTSTGGLGEGFDLLVIDEAQEYTEDQESALKYTVTDSANPQTIMCGTPPTPLSSGTVFTDYRQTTLDGGNKYSGWAEWSVPELHDIHDVDAWYMTNPSMAIT